MKAGTTIAVGLRAITHGSVIDGLDLFHRQPVIHVAITAFIYGERGDFLHTADFDQHNVALPGPVLDLFLGQAQFGLVLLHKTA